ncbi:hypothetical protein E2C01_062213 [Portunus trituberculatus]|uniref:Uncharacterized protein n=1 Tax=Portunus trituberculatus TaxID=210409 RepID=A0A5B7HD07_PORTR|nr:hypothetical protein [Portunus trituberculatus]
MTCVPFILISELYATFLPFLFHRFLSLNEPRAAHPSTHTHRSEVYMSQNEDRQRWVGGKVDNLNLETMCTQI